MRNRFVALKRHYAMGSLTKFLSQILFSEITAHEANCLLVTTRSCLELPREMRFSKKKPTFSVPFSPSSPRPLFSVSLSVFEKLSDIIGPFCLTFLVLFLFLPLSSLLSQVVRERKGATRVRVYSARHKKKRTCGLHK